MSEPQDIPALSQAVIEWLRENDPAFFSKDERDDGVDERINALEIRIESQSPIEDDDTEPKLLDDGRFKIDATDLDADFHETKVPDETTIAGTSLGVQWTEVGADGTKKTRTGSILVSDVAVETGISGAIEDCYNISGDDSVNVESSPIDFRGRLLQVVAAWITDTEANSDTSTDWGSYRLDRFRCGATATGGSVGGRSNSILVDSFGVGGGTMYLLLDSNSGKFYAMGIGVTGTIFHIRVDAGKQFDADSNTDMDGV